MAQNSTYLVTGGAGFIGSHLIDSLLAVQLAIRRILEWLPTRRDAKDDLRLPKEAKPVLSK